MATDNFPEFAKLVHDSFQSITAGTAGDVFVTNVDGDALYVAYLTAFPEGTNPHFKERSEHDCSCCKQFIRRAGTAVAVGPSGKKLRTVWQDAASEAPYPYNVVAKALHELVSNSAIVDLYRVGLNETCFGVPQTRTMSAATGQVQSWNHFYTGGPIPATLRAELPDQVRGEYRTTVQVFERGLKELSSSAVATVLSLVDDNVLYRGAEHRPALVQFQAAQKKFNDLDDGADGDRSRAAVRQMFLWTNARGPASRFRNTVIGSLVQDLSEDKDVEYAVKGFETKVAPQNYKRTSAVITPSMVKQAMETIQALGLEPALERRFARLEDISVNDVLWVDSGVKPLMKGGIADVLQKHAAAATGTRAEDDAKRAEPISMDDFVEKILSTASGMEVLFTGAHLGNLLSLTAPVHPPAAGAAATGLFKWSNDFAWSYAGNVADSIKERVKKAGGNVTNAALRISLSWFNHDDLDLHVIDPRGERICFRNKKGRLGTLDVDMNAGGGTTREPVENIAFVTTVDGQYDVVVHNFRKREDKDVGFTVETENAGKLSHFSYKKAVRDQSEVRVVSLLVKNGVVVNTQTNDASITSAAISQEKWGLTTETYVKVNAVTLSPNYWSGAHGTGNTGTGNKHTCLLLDGAKNDEPTRGIYNEFLHPRLEQHRKVFEVIGEKTKCQPTEGQLSGLGFSSTKRDAVLIRVQQGKKQRLFNVQVGADAVITPNKEKSHVQHV